MRQVNVGIITLYDNANYGNRLQNCALSSIIQSFGAKIYTIEVSLSRNRWKLYIKKILISKFGYFLLNVLTKICGNKQEKLKRELCFRKFTNKHIKMQIVDWREIENKNWDAVDYFITGSDQVWNPYWAGKPYQFLTFAPPEKRLACMASIGVTELPEEVIPNYKKWLSEMKYISVREKSAAELIENLTGRKVDVFLDPTLLLPREKWLNLCKRPKATLPEKYIVSFFLGEIPEEMIRKYAEMYDLPVVYLNSKDFPEYYVLDPAEFLYVLEHAELMLTDSFHGTALSLKLWKQFYVFRRKEKDMENMFTRIEMLLETFKLDERYRERVWNAEYEEQTARISAEKFVWIEEETQKEAARFKETMQKNFGM